MNTTTTVSLTDFLLARIAEDEGASSSATKAPWIDDPSTLAASVYAPVEDVYVTDPHNWDALSSDTAHIARHDPARVLAECKAKRAIIGASVETLATTGSGFPADDSGYGEAHSLASFTLRALALPYADHADYCEEWKL